MDLGILFLRLGLGLVFTGHGLQKAFGLFAGPGINGLSKMLSGLGFAPAGLWAGILAYSELLCGLAVLLGFQVKWASGILLIVMLVAIFKIHLAKGFFASAGGFEYPFVLACLCLALIFLGGGKFSLFPK